MSGAPIHTRSASQSEDLPVVAHQKHGNIYTHKYYVYIYIYTDTSLSLSRVYKIFVPTHGWHSLAPSPAWKVPLPVHSRPAASKHCRKKNICIIAFSWSEHVLVYIYITANSSWHEPAALGHKDRIQAFSAWVSGAAARADACTAKWCTQTGFDER